MDWNPSQEQEFRKNYQELKNLLDGTLKKVKQVKDFREAKGLLINVQNSFKGLKLNRNDREELYTKLQDAFEEINKKIANERSLFENEALSNYSDFKMRVDEAVFLANNVRDFHETWNYLVEVQSSFKGAKLLREHREELFKRLQGAFDLLKQTQSKEKSIEFAGSSQSYEQLLTNVDDQVAKASVFPDIHQYREELISLQAAIREAKLVKEHRDELNSKIQEAFLILQIRKDEEIEQTRMVSLINFKKYQPEVDELLRQADESDDFHLIREKIKTLQSEIRDSKLLREQREELYSLLQKAFELLGKRQDEKQQVFSKEATDNYERLKLLVEKGFTQAEETSKYKETREFLKKIQSEFSAVKMVREQREELYSRLQSAFTILNKRVDEFFREKKKNWMLKMQYKFSESSGEIFLLQQSLEKDQTYLAELEDQLEIVILARKSEEIIAGLKSRINSTKKSIERKRQEILTLENKMNELQNIIEPQEPEE
jgi:hypothetical protein